MMQIFRQFLSEQVNTIVNTVSYNGVSLHNPPAYVFAGTSNSKMLCEVGKIKPPLRTNDRSRFDK